MRFRNFRYDIISIPFWIVHSFHNVNAWPEQFYIIIVFSFKF